MIRVKYNNEEWKEYSSIALAKFGILTELFASRGGVIPVEAVDVFGTTTGGVTVERPLTIKLGAVELE
jgi:hypothetical protein